MENKMSIIIERKPEAYIWENGMPLLLISNQEMVDLIAELIKQIKEDKLFKPDLIISIGNGGIFLGDAISKILNLPHAIFRAKAYESKSDNHQEIKHQVIIAAHSLFIDKDKKLNHLPANFTPYYKQVLIIDHLADSGDTFHSIEKEMHKRHLGDYIIHTACLWLKSSSKYEPNYFSTYIYPERESGKMPWIVEPKDMVIKKVREKLKFEKP